jgi:hypothetical protein
MTTWQKYRAHVVLTLLSLGVFIGLYHQAFFSPNSYLFSSSGDGMRNYYSYAYHTKHADELLQFDGMNYPYGEHVLYTDNHMALTSLLHLLGIENNLVGILNLLMLLGPIICCFFLFLILRRLEVPEFMAILGAIGIALLAPQVFRMEGHFSLSYSFVIPMTWYFFIRFWNSKKRWVWTLILLANSTFWIFIHAYYGLLLSAFIFCFAALYLVRNFKTLRKNVKLLVQLLLPAVIPLLAVMMLVNKTDQRVDRNTNPYGFLAYHAEAETVFMPSHAPLKPLIDKVITIEEQIWEGWAYVGITSILVLGFTLLYVFYHRRKRNLDRLEAVFDHQMGLFLLTGILLLFFAMGYPFRLNLLWLLDAIPGLGQFRAVGRFAWIFYFIITVFSVRMISIYAHELLLKRRKVWAYGLIIFGLGFYVVEGLPHHFEMRAKIVQTANLFDINQLDAETTEMLAAIDEGKYQALLPLPYFHVGSEIFVQAGSDVSMRWSQLISYHKELPMLASSLGRTSVSETRSLLELVDWRPHNKSVVELLDQEKPILVLSTSPLDVEMHYFLTSTNAREFYASEHSQLSLYEIMPSDFPQEQDKLDFVVLGQIAAKMRFDSVGASYTSASDEDIYFRDFDAEANPESFEGAGCLSLSTPEGYTELLSFDPSEMDLNTEYIVSFWYRYKMDGFGPAIVVSQDDSYMETKVQFQPFSTEVKYGNVFEGDWVLIEMPITLSSNEKAAHVGVHNIRNGHESATIDNFIVRRADVHYLKNQPAYLWWNNYRITK